MSDIKVKLNSAQVVKLLQSQEVMGELEKVAAENFGEIETEFVGFDRCHIVCKEN